MKFTGVYATYYQDICKQLDKAVAKCKNAEKSEPALTSYYSGKVKTFNKKFDEFNGTTIVSNTQMLVNGVSRYIGGSILSETILQIQCIYSLRNICFEILESYYMQTKFSDIKSWEDSDALFGELEKEYAFIREMLKLYIAERRNLKTNALPAINGAEDLRKAYEHVKKICFDQTVLVRRRSLPEFKRISSIAVRGCRDWFAKGKSIIFYQPYHL